ncbi:MAG: PfaD family polyunsaturated fatty acid/polyketide biosynthesis protein, partial [Desulfobacterales bacterium]|nr:PfaD family polyunsaturated fatty acid/polyketide biosynthesis protein [Desulfobacterales bacterium]
MEENIRHIQSALGETYSFGVNFLSGLERQAYEEALTDLLLKYRVKAVEAAAFLRITKALVRYRLKGLDLDENGLIKTGNKVIAKISRPEVAQAFLSPAPDHIVRELLDRGAVTAKEAELAALVPMADDICVEADSGGHTDQGSHYVLIPAVLQLRDRMMKTYQYKKKVRIGAAGGIGTPEAAAAAFVLGAEFILTGSINQCSVEAGISEAAKDMLQKIDVQDTAYAPAGDMFEMKTKVQVMKKGVFFPARANKLKELYRRYGSLEDIDKKTRIQLQEKYFHQSFDQVYEGISNRLASTNREKELEKAEQNPKRKMALVFKS